MNTPLPKEEGPWFLCDGCLTEMPVYLGRYKHDDKELCHVCFAPIYESECDHEP
jgi:hypothetical protein